MNTTFKVYFNVKGLDESLYGLIPGLKEAMQNELIRVYNMYADLTNAGVTDLLNKEFDNLYPTYFKDNADKEWYDMTVYNRFMAEGYQRKVVGKLNETNSSQILDFYVDPNEVIFKGMLKVDHRITIDFYMREA